MLRHAAPASKVCRFCTVLLRHPLQDCSLVLHLAVRHNNNSVAVLLAVPVLLLDAARWQVCNSFCVHCLQPPTDQSSGMQAGRVTHLCGTLSVYTEGASCLFLVGSNDPRGVLNEQLLASLACTAVTVAGVQVQSGQSVFRRAGTGCRACLCGARVHLSTTVVCTGPMGQTG